MGRFSVDIEIANHRDVIKAEEGNLDPAKVRRATLRGVIDSGAARLVLPESVAKQLGLPVKRAKVRVRYADGRDGVRKEVDDVHVQLMGREYVFSAIVEPKRQSALIGAIVLEVLDLLVDCSKLCLVPRDKKHVVSEIE